MLGIVAKQLKSHPAVSPEPRFFLKTRERPADIESAEEDARCAEARARPPNSHLNYLTRHRLLLSFIAIYSCCFPL